MWQVPLQRIPAQTFNVILAGQYCLISLYWRQERLYLDLIANGSAVCRGAICQNRADIVQSSSPYFSGTLHFIDTEGERPPHWEALNSRYFLIYVAADEDLPDILRF